MRASSTTGADAAAADAPVRDAEPSFDALYASHYARLVRVAWLLLRDTGRAEELVQDAFVELHRRRRRLRGDAGAYLYVAVLNRSRSALRHRRVAGSVLLEPGEVQVSAETEAMRGLERRRVLDALDRLPRRQREVLVLRYYAGLDEAGTAATLGISRGSVKTHTSRGVRALRPLLGGDDEA